MIGLVFHPDTRREAENYIRHPSHALLIVGPEGSGKRSLSEHLAAQILGLGESTQLGNYPFAKIIGPDNGRSAASSSSSISIETIRELIRFTKLKVAGIGSKIQRLIIIDGAENMTAEAQNALLKLLEEPPAGTVFILNVTRAEVLLPTVRSRSQQLTVKQPAREALITFFEAAGFSERQSQSAYMMSGGLPGLMHALIADESEHPLVKAAGQARELLRAKTFERLCLVDGLSKQKPDCLRLFFMLQQMARAALANAAKNGASDRTLKQWQRILKSAYDAENALNTQAQAKLVLTNLMLTL